MALTLNGKTVSVMDLPTKTDNPFLNERDTNMHTLQQEEESNLDLYLANKLTKELENEQFTFVNEQDLSTKQLQDYVSAQANNNGDKVIKKMRDDKPISFRDQFYKVAFMKIMLSIPLIIGMGNIICSIIKKPFSPIFMVLPLAVVIWEVIAKTKQLIYYNCNEDD